MGLVILLGLLLALTPIIGSLFFPQPDVATQMAKDDVARSALASWFQAPVNALVDVKAVRKTTSEAKISRYSFSTTADVMRSFIQQKQLKQKDLTAQVMQNIFIDKTLPWWQPEALQRKTWFHGFDHDSEISLIYNAQTQRGVMIIKQKK